MLKLTDAVIDIAYTAGDIILQYYDNDHDQSILKHKQDNTPLTDADLASDAYIQQQLKQLTPHIPIISEESQLVSASIRNQWHQSWIIDPLDGTKGFLKKNGEFTVNIALVINHQPVIGVVYAPATKTCYYATKDAGAFKININQTTNSIGCDIRPTNQPIKILLTGDNPSEQMMDILSILGQYAITAQLSSIKFCQLAEGNAHLYPRIKPTSEWDTAAAHCILREAGGEILNFYTKQPLLYNKSDSILNPPFIAFSNALLKEAHTLIHCFQQQINTK